MNTEFSSWLIGFLVGIIIMALFMITSTMPTGAITECHKAFSVATNRADSLQIMLDNGQCLRYAELTK